MKPGFFCMQTSMWATHYQWAIVLLFHSLESTDMTSLPATGLAIAQTQRNPQQLSSELSADSTCADTVGLLTSLPVFLISHFNLWIPTASSYFCFPFYQHFVPSQTQQSFSFDPRPDCWNSYLYCRRDIPSNTLNTTPLSLGFSAQLCLFKHAMQVLVWPGEW